MSWITYDYVCTACGLIEDHMMKREDIKELVECTSCGAPAGRRVGCTGVMNAALPDGTRRFEGIREQRKLQKLAKKAFWRRDKDTQRRAQAELNKLNKRS